MCATEARCTLDQEPSPHRVGTGSGRRGSTLLCLRLSVGRVAAPTRARSWSRMGGAHTWPDCHAAASAAAARRQLRVGSGLALGVRRRAPGPGTVT